MITLANLHLKIQNQVLLVNESMHIYDGNIHVIMGESGSGKTSLLHEIALLSHYTNAQYKWDNIRIDKLKDQQRAEIRRTRIGFILQDLELISESLTLKDNIACMFALIGQEYNSAEVNQYFHQLKLNVSLDQMPLSLSRGERQRFALLLALIKDVDLIICDEPTSALDQENAKELMNILRYICKEYNKMVVIATHDSFVAEYADVLYIIDHSYLIMKKDTMDKTQSVVIKKDQKINKLFYHIYKKRHHDKIHYGLNVLYVIVIIILCVVPMILDMLLSQQESLYQSLKTNEIIVVNTKEVLPHTTYNGSSQLFTHDQMNMLKEIKHIQSVEYYWELDAIVNIQNKTIQAKILPKIDIDTCVVSSHIINNIDANITIMSVLKLNNQEYSFNQTINQYKIQDDLNAVIYMPTSMIKEMLAKENIETSSAFIVYCDDIKNIDSTVKEIKNWFSYATVSSHGDHYRDEIENIKTLQQFILILKFVLIIGTVIITYIIQSLQNKSRENEIGVLRINGVEKRQLYHLYYYENKTLVFITMILSILMALFLKLYFHLEFSFIVIVLLFVKVVFYIVITRIIPIIISLQHTLKKDITTILRNVN